MGERLLIALTVVGCAALVWSVSDIDFEPATPCLESHTDIVPHVIPIGKSIMVHMVPITVCDRECTKADNDAVCREWQADHAGWEKRQKRGKGEKHG